MLFCSHILLSEILEERHQQRMALLTDPRAREHLELAKSKIDDALRQCGTNAGMWAVHTLYHYLNQSLSQFEWTSTTRGLPLHMTRLEQKLLVLTLDMMVFQTPIFASPPLPACPPPLS
jgi:hypothetical protein